MNSISGTRPDFEEFEKVIRGDKPPARVHLAELGMDQEVAKAVTEQALGGKWTPAGPEVSSQYMQQHVRFYAALGYDYIPAWAGFDNVPEFKERKAADTAALSHGERRWVEEGGGIIKNWDDFERIGWDRIRPDFRGLE